jgi:hypothetical protein
MLSSKKNLSLFYQGNPKLSVMTHNITTIFLMIYSTNTLGITMRFFHPLNNLVVTRNVWLILLSKMSYSSNLVEHVAKNKKL